MMRLGFWQLDRMHEKDALLARYAQRGPSPGREVAFPQGPRCRTGALSSRTG
jgi:cytochrome oxidase assembly protein ShyY1